MPALLAQRLVCASSTGFPKGWQVARAHAKPWHPDFPLQGPAGRAHRCTPCGPGALLCVRGSPPGQGGCVWATHDPVAAGGRCGVLQTPRDRDSDRVLSQHVVLGLRQRGPIRSPTLGIFSHFFPGKSIYSHDKISPTFSQRAAVCTSARAGNSWKFLPCSLVSLSFLC